MSVDDYQFVIWQVVPDRMGEGDGFAVIDGSGIDPATLELINKRLVVISSH